MTETCAAAGSYPSALWEKTKANYADSIEIIIDEETEGEGVNVEVEVSAKLSVGEGVNEEVEVRVKLSVGEGVNEEIEVGVKLSVGEGVNEEIEVGVKLSVGGDKVDTLDGTASPVSVTECVAVGGTLAVESAVVSVKPDRLMPATERVVTT